MTTPSTTTAPMPADPPALDLLELPVAAPAWVTVHAAQRMHQRGCPWAVSGDDTTLVNRVRAEAAEAQLAQRNTPQEDHTA